MLKEFVIFGYKVFAKVYDEGSKFGIEGFPRISKLSIWQDGKEVFNYDRGLDFSELHPLIVKWICGLAEWWS